MPHCKYLSNSLVNNEVGLVSIINTSITANLTHGNLVAGILNNSTIGGGHGKIIIKGSTITVNGDDANLVGGLFNQANNVTGDSAMVDVSQSTITITSNNNGGGTAAGVLTSGNGTVSVNNSIIRALGTNSSNIFGVVVGDATATAILRDTTIISVGAQTQNNGGTLICYQNGVNVPC